MPFDETLADSNMSNPQQDLNQIFGDEISEIECSIMINPPIEQTGYSATAHVNVNPSLVRSLGQQSDATNIPVKFPKENIQMETEEVKKDNKHPPHDTKPNALHVIPKLKFQVANRAGGNALKICDMNRLRRYIVLGAEENTYYSTNVQNTIDNIQCLQRLIEENRHEEVIDTITEYSLAGRIARESPILTILAYCAEHKDLKVQKYAYTKVAEICNVPEKLFRFLDLSQIVIENKRETNPPERQKNRNGLKRKKEESIASLAIKDDILIPHNNDETPAFTEKKNGKKVNEFKKVNMKPKKSSGWGRMRRKAVSKFYQNKDACRLLYLMTKYKSRHNWSHKEVISFCHPTIDGDEKVAKDLVISYCLKGYAKVKQTIEKDASAVGASQGVSKVAAYIKKIEEVKQLLPDTLGDEERLVDILKEKGYGGIRDIHEEYTMAYTCYEPDENTEYKSAVHIVREHIHTGFLNSYKVWEAALVDMPMTALIRCTGKMSSLGLFKDQNNVDIAVSSLTNVKKLKMAKIHPFQILTAMKCYEQGHGEKGGLKWQVNRDIVKAFDEAFYKCFQDPDVKDNYKTGLNYMLCLDVSPSMASHGCTGCTYITPALASFAMALVAWNVEDNVEIVAFGDQLEDMKERGFQKKMLITDAMKQAEEIKIGSAGCSSPMIHALNHRLEIDVFIIYTDSDILPGNIQPVTALRNYNLEMKRTAKLIVVGMGSSGFTIADPLDPDMLDIVGFDPNVPEIISEFAKGNLSGVCNKNCTECQVNAS